MRLILVGGHLTPAIAFLENIKDKADEVWFVGRVYASNKDKIPSREKVEAEKLNAKFIEFDAPKIERHDTLISITKLPLVLLAVARARLILNTVKPDVVVTFGGYLSVPVAMAASLAKIPLVIHEQTRTVGLSNQIVGKFAQKVCLSWPESKKYFSNHKIVITGNLVRKEILNKLVKRPEWARRFDSKPILYISGGNQGSLTINRTVEELLNKLTAKYNIIHQCGPLGLGQSMDKIKRQSYVVRSWFDGSEVAWILKNSALVISRSGANTVSEIMISKLPAIFIPLPFAYKNEQWLNANFLTKMGVAEILPQENLTKDSLWRLINKMILKRAQYSRGYLMRGKLKQTMAVEAMYKVVRDVYDEKKKI